MKGTHVGAFTLCLSVITIITSIPITSYAANDNLEGNGGGTGNGGEWTGSGSGSYFSLDNKIGYRFTIVDSTGKTVSLINGKPGSLDIVWSAPPTEQYIKLTASKFESTDNTQGGWRYITINEAMTNMGINPSGENCMPPWVTKDKTIQGELFKTWMIKDGIGIASAPIGGDSGSGSGSSSSSGGSSGSASKPSGGSGSASKPSGGGGGSSAKPSGGKTTSKESQEDYSKRLQISITNTLTSGAQSWSKSAKYPSLTDKIESMIPNLKASALRSYTSGKINKAQYEDALHHIDIRKTATIRKYASNNKLESLLAFIKDGFIPLTVYADTGADSAGSNYVDPQEHGWAGYLINMKDSSGKYILDLEGTDPTIPIRPYDIMRKNVNAPT